MAIFDDYMQKEQAGNYNQQRLQMQQDEQARKDSDLARTLAPYVADALKEIGKVVYKLGYINDYVHNTFVTGKIFKRTDYTVSYCWNLRKFTSDGMSIKEVPSAVLFTNDDQYITPFKGTGTATYGQPKHYEGTKVSLAQASQVVAEEMVSSVNAFKKFYNQRSARYANDYNNTFAALVDKGQYAAAVKMYFERTLMYLKNRKYTD